MNKKFIEPSFREIDVEHDSFSSNVIKADKTAIKGSKKVTIFEESLQGIKVILEKDKEDNIREIKFQCSCGQTKSIILDYDD